MPGCGVSTPKIDRVTAELPCRNSEATILVIGVRVPYRAGRAVTSRRSVVPQGPLGRIQLNPHQIQLVQDSYAKVGPIADQAARLFYDRLFEIAPEVRPMFKGDMEEQGRKLMAMIGTAVRGLGNLGELVPVVQNLGRRHATYGVADDHYEVVAEALLWTLEKGLGESFTGDVKEAWTSAYVLLADTMRQAARNVAAE